VLLYGAPGGIRTHKIRILNPTRIPIPSPGQNIFYFVKERMQ
jgi:hypothetical protein